MRRIIPSSRRRSARTSSARQARSRQPAPLRALFREQLQFRPAVEALEVRSLMATMTSLDFSDILTMANTGVVPAEFSVSGPLHNSFDAEDVNDDGTCSPSDALTIINAINAGNITAASSSSTAAASDTGTTFCDVNGDGQTSPADALTVINRINNDAHRQPPPTTSPTPTPTTTGIRSIDGTGNNTANPTWGSAGVDLLRTAPAAYSDGLSAPAGDNRPSARVISNTVADSGGQLILNSQQLSAMAYAWGQFIDHDMDLTPTGGSDVLNITVPTGDPSFDPASTGTQVISTTRSIFDPATGTTDPRQQVNTITAFLDGSMIYGSSDATATALRTGSGGQLKTSTGNLLPLNNDATFPNGTLPMANDAGLVPSSQLFAAGDLRANENIELTALQTLFMREHNQWATKIAAANPNLTDEQIYQQARAIVIGEIQAITYNQWLPTLLGNGAISTYRGYNANVNPGIANEFSTAAFRFGHSLLGDDIEFLDNNGNETQPSVELAQAFFNPTIVEGAGIDPLLKYLSSDQAQELDTKVVDSVRNFLFGPPGAGGLDLASLNIERGRDNGIADYNSLRAAYGLPKVTSFAQITADTDLQAKLQSLYGSVETIDAWVGLLAEKHVAGADVGPTLKAIMADQFTRLRDGDRFWYQRVFTGSQLSQISNTTLADIIERNSSVSGLQSNVFVFKALASGTVYLDANGDGVRSGRAELGLPGVTVRLLDEDGQVIASTVTSIGGTFRFDQFSGTGDYRVQLVLPTGSVLTTASLLDLHISGGGVSVRNLNFGLKSNTTTPPPATDDSFENNDTSATASNLGTITAPKTISNLVMADSADWYRFTTTAAGQSGDSVSIAFQNSQGNLDLEVFNSAGQRIGTSTSTTANSEQISLKGLAAGTYLIHVFGASGATNPSYSLTINVTPPVTQPPPPPPTNGTFDVQFRFTGLTSAQQAIFQQAAARWSSIITSDLPAATYNGIAVDDLLIDASSASIDGTGNILAESGPDRFRSGSQLPYHGTMQFDTADLAAMQANGTFLGVIEHEMGHILGIGTLWQQKGLLAGANTNNPTFVGQQTVAQYDAIFHTTVTGVPVENTGGGATRKSHWRETVFRSELMTGFVGPGTSLPISRVTIASLADLGYSVNLAAADPYTPPGLRSGALLAAATATTPADVAAIESASSVTIVQPLLVSTTSDSAAPSTTSDSNGASSASGSDDRCSAAENGTDSAANSSLASLIDSSLAGDEDDWAGAIDSVLEGGDSAWA